LKKRALEVARQCAERGPGYSQQKAVLDEVASEAGANMYTRLDLGLQQAILTCWHDLFRDGVLSWGYDLDNADPPFFHIPERQVSMGQEVAVILRLVFPSNQRKEYEFDVPLTVDELPSMFWRETDDHIAGVFEREGQTRTYVFREKMTRRLAWAQGIKCL